MYYLLTGAFPFDFPPKRDPIDVILNENVVPIRSRKPTISKPLAAVIDQAVTKKDKSRYRDAGELLAALKKTIP
jgi:serine/threonine-protein kinase